MPLTICAATRLGVESHAGLSEHPGEAVLRNDHEQRAAQRDEEVRAEARLLARYSRSSPMTAPSTPASSSRNVNSQNIFIDLN